MDTTNINGNVTNINNIRFDDTWKGSAAESQITSLNGFMQNLNQCISDITAFDAILILKDEYVKICEEIARLNSLISSCSVNHDDPESSCNCGTYAAQIQQLESQRQQLRSTIIGLLGQFSGITPEVAPPVDLTTYDNPQPEDLGEMPVVNEVPRYNQLEYTQPYGNVTLRNGNQATIRNSGCGITSLAMVASYINDDPTLTPDVLAERYGKYNTDVGSAWSLFTETSQELGLGEVKQVHDWNAGQVEQALRDGCIVISNQRGGKFTSSGHYIVLTGISEDGKVYVNDPNGANWEKGNLKDGFENGFNYTDISYTSAAYWIYEPKDKKQE